MWHSDASIQILTNIPGKWILYTKYFQVFIFLQIAAHLADDSDISYPDREVFLDYSEGSCTEYALPNTESSSVPFDAQPWSNLKNPLYDDASISLGESVLAISSFQCRYNLSKACIENLLSLIEMHLPRTSINNFPRSEHLLEKFFFTSKNPVTLMYRCSHCEGFLGASVPERCPDCNYVLSEADLKNTKSFFMYISLKKQLQDLLKQIPLSRDKKRYNKLWWYPHFSQQWILFVANSSISQWTPYSQQRWEHDGGSLGRKETKLPVILQANHWRVKKLVKWNWVDKLRGGDICQAFL